MNLELLKTCYFKHKFVKFIWIVFENKCHKSKVSLNKVEAFYTSKIGYEKYSKERKMTIHQAASFVIARRYQGFKEN